MRREDEIESFKRRIDLRHYAAGQGYEADRSKRWGNCEVMRRGGDKIVIVVNQNGHWIYWSPHDGNDGGSIIDFVQNRQRCNLGQVRQELRPWLDGQGTIPSRGGDFGPALLPITKDKAEMHVSFAAMWPVTRSSYLSGVRSLPEALIASQRFSGRIYEDHRGNAVFPHYDLEGICGYEIKNESFTGFAPGGSKGLWCSRTTDTDDTLVIGESAIDALSFAALHPSNTARYVSTGGALGPAQTELIRRTVAKMPTGSQIVLALDNDEGGDRLGKQITAIFRDSETADVTLRDSSPKGRGRDWNDVLRAS